MIEKITFPKLRWRAVIITIKYTSSIKFQILNFLNTSDSQLFHKVQYSNSEVSYLIYEFIVVYFYIYVDGHTREVLKHITK